MAIFFSEYAFFFILLADNSREGNFVEPWATLASLVLVRILRVVPVRILQLQHCWKRSRIHLSNGKFMASQLYLRRGLHQPTLLFFHSCGCNWFFEVTPAHEKPGDGIPYVALDLALGQSGLKPGHIMNAVFELSVYNHSSGIYYGRKASYSFDVKNVHSTKMFLIPLQELLNSSDYLVDDSCVFGVRILKADICSPEKKPVVISKKPITVQSLFLQKKDLIRGTYTWTMSNYPNLKPPVISPAFEVGGQKWYIRMYPLGNDYSTNSLSLFLCQHDPKELPDPESGMMIELSLSILDDKYGQHYVVKGRFVFAAGNIDAWGWSDFIPLTTFKDPSRGYLVGSNCALKADITIIGSSNDG